MTALVFTQRNNKPSTDHPRDRRQRTEHPKVAAEDRSKNADPDDSVDSAKNEQSQVVDLFDYSFDQGHLMEQPDSKAIDMSPTSLRQSRKIYLEDDNGQAAKDKV